MSNHATENERALAARRALRDAATARQAAHPCPEQCGHDHLTPEQAAAWGLWNVLRHPPVAEPIPAPEVTARPPREGEVPKTAMALYHLAHEHGWYGSITYARGPITHSRTGKFLRMADSVCVRLARQVDRRTMQRVVAAWLDGGFESAFAWGAGQPPVALAGVGPNSVKQYVTERTDRP